jgi:hypothetical protein
MDHDRGLEFSNDPGDPFMVCRASKLEIGSTHPPPWRFKIKASDRLDLVVAFQRSSNTRTNG